jgi:hypothetical protein
MYQKIMEVNLEAGLPTVEAAIQKMKNTLISCKHQQVKAVILIHGYGASGVGGGIKAGVNKCLTDSSMRGIVRAFVNGEQWHIKKREMLDICGSLKVFERRISGNSGITVVVLKNN